MCSKSERIGCAFLFLVGVIALTTPFVSVFAATTYGDANIEPVTSILVPQFVMALTKIYVTHSTTISSVSMYLQYSDSDSSQCLKFGVYGDNGAAYAQSSPMNQPLIAATRNGYCLRQGDFDPAWETWSLASSDYLTIRNAGTYWLAVLAKEAYGTVYHFTYTGAYGGQFLYQFGYFYYGFPASYTLGFPPTVFGNTTYSNANLILPFNQNNVGEYNAPFSFYVTGT